MTLDLFGDAEAIVRLTPLQQEMLAHTRRVGGGTYVGQMTVRIRGALDVDAVRRAFQALVYRHTALRTIFVSADLDEPLQVVRSTATMPLRFEDWRGRADAQQQLDAFLAVDRTTPFVLEEAPAMRVALFRLDDTLWHLVLTRHHLIMDGWSAAILFRELQTLLADETALSLADKTALSPAEPFHRFVDWLESRDRAATHDFWAMALAGAGEGTAIFPAERLARGEVPAALEEIIRPLDDAFVEQIARAARDSGVTQQTLFAGAWALLAARYAGTPVAQFGMTVAGRPEELPGIADTVGLFLDTLPTRIAVPDDMPVSAWLKRLQQQLANAMRHAHVGQAELRRLAGVTADQALFSHILVLEAYGRRGARGPGPLAIEDYQFIDQTNFALNIGVVQEDNVHLAAVFDPLRFPRAALERLLANFETALRAVIQAGARALGTIEVIAPAEAARLRDFAGIGKPAMPTVADSLPSGLATAAECFADRVALVAAGECLTYRELWARAGRVADRLIAQGVGCDRLIGVALPRSVAQVIAILGVLRAGAAFVPLDPDDPPARRAAMTADAGLDRVLDATDIATMLAGNVGDPTVPRLPGKAAAYALFTSGSTGRPKAALNTQAAIINRLAWMQSAYPIGRDDRVLQKTASTFDVAVWEFLWPLLEGATLVLAAPDAHRDPEAIRRAIIEHRITVLHLVPSVLRLFLDLDGVEACTSLRTLIVSGEALDADLPGLLQARLPQTQLHNLYGPAEAAIDVTAQDLREIAPGQIVPIGRPIDGATIQLLDRRCAPVPWGAIGEVAIGGIPVGRGYVGRADLTADRFVPDPSGAAGSRLYRTGDLAAWDEAGRLIFHGRADHQVKLRGQRIELGEVEAALRAVAGVADAAVLIAGKGAVDAALVAHVVAADPVDEAAIERIAGEMRQMLPVALVPTRWHVHSSLPRLPSQKIDRRALAAFAGGTRRQPVPPRNDEEAQLAGLWAQVLGRSDIGVTDDFFELGGHSLLLMRLVNLIRQEFGVETELAELFDATTIETQLTLIVDKLLAAADPERAAQFISEV